MDSHQLAFHVEDGTTGIAPQGLGRREHVLFAYAKELSNPQEGLAALPVVNLRVTQQEARVAGLQSRYRAEPNGGPTLLTIEPNQTQIEKRVHTKISARCLPAVRKRGHDSLAGCAVMVS